MIVSIASILIESSDYLVWIDLEMTGLADTDVTIEMATIVTDLISTRRRGPVIAIHQPSEVLDAMDEWNKRTDGASGPIDRVRDPVATPWRARRNARWNRSPCWSTWLRRRCVATASARTGVSSRATCRARAVFA